MYNPVSKTTAARAKYLWLELPDIYYDPLGSLFAHADRAGSYANSRLGAYLYLGRNYAENSR